MSHPVSPSSSLIASSTQPTQNTPSKNKFSNIIGPAVPKLLVLTGVIATLATPTILGLGIFLFANPHVAAALVFPVILIGTSIAILALAALAFLFATNPELLKS